MAASSLPVRDQRRVTHVSIFSTHITDTWFRVLVKTAARDAYSSYTWHEMTFCSQWISDRYTILCTGASPLFRRLLKDALAQAGTMFLSSEPCSLHVPLLEAIAGMQDSSGWSLREIVRGIEKVIIVESVGHCC
jgi:hypothetical protein